MHAITVHVRTVIQVHSFLTSGLGTRGLFHSPEVFLRWSMVWPKDGPWHFGKELCAPVFLRCCENNHSSFKLRFTKYQYIYICILYTDLSVRKRNVYPCTLYTHVHACMHLRRNVKFQRIMVRSLLRSCSVMRLTGLDITGKRASITRHDKSVICANKMYTLATNI
jgi:hypothetical protein